MNRSAERTPTQPGRSAAPAISAEIRAPDAPAIEILEHAPAPARMAELVALLVDAVESGASVGYVLPVNRAEIRAFWDGALDDARRGAKEILIACAGDVIIGCVILDLVMKPNGLHRADVQKLLVHSRWRRRRLGLLLMRAVEDIAGEHGRSLLVLDTQSGSPASTLYQRLGYTRCGDIPNYAGLPDGSLIATTIYYKELR